MSPKAEEIRRAIQDLQGLPTLPGIIRKLGVLSDNAKSTIDEMARLVSSDQILSAKVLRLVNSPFYGFSGRISTVSKALILLGVNVVKGLALSTSIFEIMERHVIGLWEHSLGSAVAANIISKKLGLSDGEEIATAALLHDIGKVIIKLKLQGDLTAIESLCGQKGIPLYEAERECLGTDHAEIGLWLGKAWFLPEKLIEPIAYHHDVARSATHRVRTAVVHVSDLLIKASGFGFSGDEMVSRLDPVAWQTLRLSEAKLQPIIEEMEDQLVDVKNFSLEVQLADGPKS